MTELVADGNDAASPAVSELVIPSDHRDGSPVLRCCPLLVPLVHSCRLTQSRRRARQDTIEVGKQLVGEALPIEAQRLPPCRGRGEVVRLPLELLKRGRQTLGVLLGEPQAGWLPTDAGRQHRLGSAAAAEGDDRSAAGHGLHRHDAEVLLAGEQQRRQRRR